MAAGECAQLGALGHPVRLAVLRYVVFILWIAYWVCLFVSTHVPMPAQIPRVRHGDKVLHFVAFLGLTLLGGSALTAWRRVRTLSTLQKWAGISYPLIPKDVVHQGF